MAWTSIVIYCSKFKCFLNILKFVHLLPDSIFSFGFVSILHKICYVLHGGVWGGFVNVTKKRYVTLKCYVILDGEDGFTKKNALKFVTFPSM